MRQAIETKFVGPTNTKPARIIARADAGRRVYNWDHTLGMSENHRGAAVQFAREFGWTGRWCGGGTQHGYVFVAIDHDEFEVAK